MGRRGPQPKPAEDRQRNEVRVYLTDAELADLDIRAAQAGQSRSAVARSAITGGGGKHAAG